MTDKCRLLESLQAIGRSAIRIPDTHNGSEIVVLPAGGRILGLYPAGSNTNFLWTNPRLETPEQAGPFFASDEWLNVGGDRTWLAPELEFFFPKFPTTDVYVQPRPLDPGSYLVEQRDSRVTLRNDLRLSAYRARVELHVRITKSVRAINRPRAASSASAWAELPFAGYELTTALEILDAPAAVPYVGLWNLLQLPAGGEILIPTYDRCQPTVFFGDIPSGDLFVEDRAVRYRTSAPGEQKISVPAVASTGRTGYVWHDLDVSHLVIRNFHVDPSGEYVDAWSTHPEDMGYAVQACNINSQWGCFSEMEYHAPAIGGNTGRQSLVDVSQVWAFRGPTDRIRSTAETLLGCSTVRHNGDGHTQKV